jgi:hypothetical protein
MEEYTIKLSKADLHNLNQFLNTVSLSGKDAMIFVQLVSKINRPAPIENKEE